MINGTSLSRVFALAFSLLFAAAAAAQGAPPAAPPPQLAAIGKQWGQDLAGMTRFTFQQRTAIEFKGEDKGATLVQVTFGPDGKPLVTPLSAPEPQGRPKRGVRGAIQENKKDEFKEKVEGLVALANAYLLPDAQKMQALFAKAQLQIVPAENAIQLAAQGYLQAGDQVLYTFDATTHRLRGVRIQAAAGGQPATIEAKYRDLAGGPTVSDQTVIASPPQQLVVKLSYFNYLPK